MTPLRHAVMVFFVAFLACNVSATGPAPTTVSDPPSDPPPVLLSRQLLARAHVGLGDTITLATDAAGHRAHTFRVAGVYEPTPDPMRFTAERLEARLHLTDLAVLSVATGDTVADADPADSVSRINVRLTDAADAARFATDVSARMPGLAVHSTSRPADGDPFAVLDRFHLAISVVTVAGSTAFLLALMVIRAEERRETIGALRLLGISRRSLLVEVAVEGLLIAAAGAIFGALVAFAAEGIVNRVFQTRYDTALVFVRVTRAIALRSIALAVPLGVVAGVAASWTLLRRDILSLVRR